MLLGNRIQLILKNFNCSYCQNAKDLNPPWKVLFFGNDEFAVTSLKALRCEQKLGEILSNLEVVTSIKKNANPVEKYALQENLTTHNWSPDVSLCHNFHVGVVVSFGHLIPANIINSFSYGMLNVHASLLPRWRGAAPIIHALSNGDTSTGITIMKVKASKFDIGEIVAQAPVLIPPHVKMPELHNTLANLGAETLVATLRNLPENMRNAIPQPVEEVTLAPKVNSKTALLDWSTMTATKVYNLERALTGVMQLHTKFNDIPVKLYNVRCCDSETLTDTSSLGVPGFVKYDKKSRTLRVQCAGGSWIEVDRVGIPGKNISAMDFNNGFISKCDFKSRVFR